MEKQTELAKAREKWITSMENAAKSRSGRPLRNRTGRHAFPEVVRQRRQVLQGMAKPLKRWLIKHRDNPYPTREEKISLALGSQMTLMQVSNWFANARRRLKNTVKTPNADWPKRIKMYNSCVVGNAELLSISSDDSIWDSDDMYKDETEIIPSEAEPMTQDRKTNEDHSYSALDGLVPYSSLRDACRPQTMTDERQIPLIQDNTTPDSKPHVHMSAPAIQCKRSREASEDEDNLSDEVPCKDQYDHRPKKYKRHILQRYLYDSYRKRKIEAEAVEHQKQDGKCQRTEKCRDSVGGSCSESERSHSNSQSPSSSNSAKEFRFSGVTEVDVSRQLFRPNENPVFERLKNGRYWKEFDAAIVLANLGRTAMVKPPTSGMHSPAIGLSTTCTSL